MSLLAWFKKLRERRRIWCAASVGFDTGRWARVLLTLAALAATAAIAAQIVYEVLDGLPILPIIPPASATLLWSLSAVSAGYCLLLSLYLGHLFFARLQCSLLEFFAVVTILGICEGLLFNTPGMLAAPRLCLLIAAAIPPWLLAGAVEGLVDARLLRVSRPAVRLSFILAECGGAASHAVIGVGILLWTKGPGNKIAPYISDDMSHWGLAVMIFGILGLLGGGTLGFLAKRAAKKLLEPPAVPSPGAAAGS